LARRARKGKIREEIEKKKKRRRNGKTGCRSC
jgi:hypothetical protein